MVSAENSDRNLVYRAIVEQNSLDSSALVEIQRVFAEEQRERAKSGDLIQLPAGEWVRK
jgi:uncharacterized protein YdbL (DUF1318 family)